jgi:hypothetical protein
MVMFVNAHAQVDVQWASPFSIIIMHAFIQKQNETIYLNRGFTFV